ncbi:VanZ like family protein [compost metagenome]
MSHFYYVVGIRNVLGNIVLLLPLALLVKREGSWRILQLGFFISLSIEISQVVLTKSGLVMSRSFDVDDLILNTVGFYVGYLINGGIRKLKTKRITRSRHSSAV